MKEITMEDIIQAIAQELKTLFPKAKVYDEGLEQGYEEPCFFIDFIRENTKKMVGNRYDDTVSLRTVYFQDFHEDEARYKAYRVRDTLNEGFNIITYKNMHFRIKEKDIEMQDKDLIFTFKIQFYTKKKIEDEPKLDSIEKITEKEKENA